MLSLLIYSQWTSFNSYYEKNLATGTVRCIDSEIPFDIPNGWEWARISTLFIINPKNTAEDDNIDAGFVPMERIEPEIGSNYTYENRTWKHIKSGYTHFADGDVAFAKITPCFQNLKSVIFEGLPNGIGSGSTELKVLRNYDNTIEQWYLLLYLQSPYFIENAVFKGTANQQRIVTGYLEDRLFPIPPLKEQKRIVRCMHTLIPLIKAYYETSETFNILNVDLSESLKKSILQEAIQGRLVPQIESEGTAEDLLAEIRAEKQRLVKEGKLKKSVLTNESRIFRGDDNRYYEQKGTENICIQDEIPFEIPDTWGWIRGKSAFLPMTSAKPHGDMFTYIDLDAVDNKLNIITNPKRLKVSNAPSRASRELQHNDILFSMVRPYLRNIAIVPDNFHEAIASTGFYIIRASVGYDSAFLFWLMMSDYVVNGLNQFMKGDNSPSINNSHIEEWLYPLPPIDEQHRIVAKIEQLFERVK